MTTSLRDAITPIDMLGQIVSATISGINADGTVSVDLGGGAIATRCIVLGTYTPTMSEPVQVMRRDSSSFIVLGSVRTSNPTTVSISKAWTLPREVNPAGAAAGAQAFSTTDTASWRSNSGGWERDQVFQGAYGTNYGYWNGCFFYGDGAFDALYGRTITRAQIHLSRVNAAGEVADDTLHIALHAHGSRPSGQPLWTSQAVTQTPSGLTISLARNEVGDFDLPLWMGQSLVDRKSKGLGLYHLSTADYLYLNSRGDDPTNGRLTLDWS